MKHPKLYEESTDAERKAMKAALVDAAASLAAAISDQAWEDYSIVDDGED